MNNLHVVNDITEVGIHIKDKEWNPAHKMRINETIILYVRKGYGKLEKNGESIYINQRDLFVVDYGLINVPTLTYSLPSSD